MESTSSPIGYIAWNESPGMAESCCNSQRNNISDRVEAAVYKPQSEYRSIKFKMRIRGTSIIVICLTLLTIVTRVNGRAVASIGMGSRIQEAEDLQNNEKLHSKTFDNNQGALVLTQATTDDNITPIKSESDLLIAPTKVYRPMFSYQHVVQLKQSPDRS